MDLIETLWNVKNHRVGGSGELIFQDLIETLWNVKSDWHLNSIQRCIGFNRDIVECKVHHNMMMPADLCGFNRDIVECKDRFHTVQPHVHSGFNRDIVECKGVYYNKLMGEISGFNRDIVECKAEVVRLLALTYYLI